jgi:hypothetical protein
MTQTYRTNDPARWGTGQGFNLSPAQVDINFWDLIQRMIAQEARPDPSAGISYFSISGTMMYVHMTDGTTLGPYELPVATFLDRGVWAPATVYAKMNTFSINGGLYVVVFDHTSAATFDPGANDGLGNDYYQLMIQTPGSSLPSGGAVGQLLQKASTTDYAVTWGYTDAAVVSFEPSTGSVLTASNVAAALEELSTASVSGGIPSDTAPSMDGTAAAGTSVDYSRGDHIHPTDTSLAPLASPALTGTPTTPTASVGTNNTQIASTAFVLANGGSVPPATAAPIMDSVAAVGVATKYAREDHVHPSDTAKAPLASPTFTGTVSAPTVSPGTDSTTKIATTAFVQSAVAAAGGAAPSGANPIMDGTAAPGSSALYSRGDHVHPSDTTKAPLASPTFTGTPAAPTATVGTNTTQIASTAFVQAAIPTGNIPQNSQSAAYTTVLADAEKHIFHPSADTTARTWTIDSNANVAYPIGTAITFVNQNAAGAITIAITSDTMRLAGAGTTGSRTLAANGVATALKVTSTEWIISGTGLT